MVSEPASPSAAAVVADPAESATEIALPPGEVVVVPNGRGYTATNAGTGDAVLIRLVVAPPRVGRPAMGASVTAESEGPGGRTLAGGAAMPLPAGPLAVAVGRVVLGPGATVAFGEADYVALLSVDTGPISAFLTRAGTVRRGADGSGVRPESARLDPGDGLAIEPGTALVLRNAGSSPVEAVLVTVLGSAR